MFLVLGHPWLRLGSAVGKGEETNLGRGDGGRGSSVTVFKAEGESPATQGRAVLFQVGSGRFRRGLQVDRAWDLPPGTPQPRMHSLLGKGGESRDRA